jgi:putative lipoprotein
LAQTDTGLNWAGLLDGFAVMSIDYVNELPPKVCLVSNIPAMTLRSGLFWILSLLVVTVAIREAIPAGIAQTAPPSLDAPLQVPTEPDPSVPPGVLPDVPLDALPDEVPPDDPAAQASVSGTVFLLQRSALPPSAILSVQLLDMTRASAASVLLAEQTIRTNGRQMPLNFEILYDPALVQEDHRYALRARILINGAIAFASPQTYPVITAGNPNRVEMRVEAVR